MGLMISTSLNSRGEVESDNFRKLDRGSKVGNSIYIIELESLNNWFVYSMEFTILPLIFSFS